MAIVLIGFMGAGKSTAARELAQALGVGAIDTDEALQERFGHPLAHEFELHGEQAFRAAEEALVCCLLDSAASGSVVALGGGSVLSERVRDSLKGHLTVLLEVAPEAAWERLQGEGQLADRPLARDRASFFALHAERKHLYEGLADATLAGLGPTGLAGVAGALDALTRAPHGTRMLWASSSSGEYPVYVARGLLEEHALAAVWPFDRALSRPFCVSDENVAPLYGPRLGELGMMRPIPAGESSKTLAVAEGVWQSLARAGTTRADHVVALGGGVVGDLAGFCAATYQRGVPVVQVPTTLVAQVDSAYGGKTGIDLPEAKNYVGAYHQPSAVLVDPDALLTLAPAELAAGWVEVLKTALIAGGSLWEEVSRGEQVQERTIFACAKTKLAAVAEDERDAGRRQVLNLGHTVGHAIETASGYSRYRHGEAVGLGLLAALRLSGQTRLHEQVEELLARRGLPVRLENGDVEAIIEAIGRDKKRVGAEVPFVMVDAPGQVSYGRSVGAGEVRSAVEELTR